MKYTSLNVIFFSSFCSFQSLYIFFFFFIYIFLLTVWCVVSSWNTYNRREHKYLYYQRFDELSTIFSLAGCWHILHHPEFLFGNYFLCILCKCFMIIVIIVMIIIWVELYYPHVEGAAKMIWQNEIIIKVKWFVNFFNVAGR